MLVLLVFYFFNFVHGQFEVPDALVQALSPMGLKVSIPGNYRENNLNEKPKYLVELSTLTTSLITILDRAGIRLYDFHGQINLEMNGKEPGNFTGTILEAKDGQWTFYDPNIKLNVNDTLYYRIHVVYSSGKGRWEHDKLNQKFVVTELINKTSDDINVTTTTTTQKPTQNSGNPNECKETVTTVNNKTSCSQKLIFSEQFDTLSSDFWMREVKFAGIPDYEFVTYVNHDDNLKVQNGILQITPTTTDDVYGEGFTTREELNLGSNCTGIPESVDCVQKADGWQTLPPVLSARISTKNKFSFKYGTIEIRAKLPQGDWMYPELYLNSRHEEYGPGYQSGQITIAFAAGNKNRSRILYSGGILGISPKARFYALRELKLNRGWTDEFHKFIIVWSKESIIIRVDDTFFRQIYPPKGGFAGAKLKLGLEGGDRWKTGTNLAPFDKEMHITVGVGVGGQWFQDTEDDLKPWKNYDPKGQKKFYKAKADWKGTWNANSNLQVDYIKIWAL